MKAEHVELADSRTGNRGRLEILKRAPNPREVLEELFELLEDYAPTWYTEEHHNRAVAALLGRDASARQRTLR